MFSIASFLNRRIGDFLRTSSRRCNLCITVAIVACGGIAHAQTAGSVDTSFAVGAGVTEIASTTPDVRTFCLQPDGKILVGGLFNSIAGVAAGNLARLNADGSVDPSFNPGSGADGEVFSFAVQADGKILVGGVFTHLDGAALSRIARLNTDGSIDPSFTPSFSDGGSLSGNVQSIVVQADGSIIFTDSYEVLRLNADGIEDPLPAYYEGGNDMGGYDLVEVLALQSDGKLIFGGNFFEYFNQDYLMDAHPVARLNVDGTLDESFNIGIVDGGVSGGTTSLSRDGGVHALAIQSDGKVLVGGVFTKISGVTCENVARLNTDGSLDISFNSTVSGQFDEVFALALQTDGKVIIAGDFTTVDGMVRGNIARLNADGTLDTTFDPGLGPDNAIDALALQPDNKVIVGGFFTASNGFSSSCIARLNGDQSTLPGFFSGEMPLSDGVYYLSFSNGNYFGYYSFLGDPAYIYHFDLGYEYVFDAADGKSGVYLYDFASSDFFYTSPSFPFPYLYDFGLNSVLYYFPDTNSAGHYTTGPRYFYDYATGQIITK